MQRPSIPLVLVGLLSASIARAELDWRWASPQPQGSDLNVLAFEDASVGYALGDRGAVLRTADGGASWALRVPPGRLAWDLHDVEVLGPGTLLAVGSPPGIFRSLDAGATWTPVPNPSTGSLYDLALVPDGTLVAVGDSGQVVRSNDGGSTWTRRPSVTDVGGMRTQLWLDGLRGIVAGDFVARRTSDGGLTWTPLPGIGSEMFNDVFAISALDLELVADFHTCRSHDGGASWSMEFVPNQQVYQATTLRVTPTHWFRAVHLEGAQILESFDAGLHWSAPYAESGRNGVLDLSLLADGTLLAVGTDGLILRSSNGGADWLDVAACACDTLPIPNISQIERIDGRTFLAATLASGGPTSAFLRSEDGGATWSRTSTAPDILYLHALRFASPSLGYAGGSAGAGSGSVWRTTDAGMTWAPVPLSGAPFANGQVLRFAIVSPETAFAVVIGAGGSAVFRTVDGGATWLPSSNGIPLGTGYLRTVHFVNAMVGFAAGGSGSTPTLWSTHDGGEHWAPIATTGLPTFITDLRFTDALHGLAASWSQGGVFGTEDGGASWTTLIAVNAREFRFVNASEGWASTAAPGVVLHTVDGGASWTAVATPMTTESYAVAPFPGGLVIGGAACRLLRAVDAALLAVPASGTSAPAALVVDRTIGRRFRFSFALASAGPAALVVHDLLGRRVAELTRGPRSAGERVDRPWDARDDSGRLVASGVYFVRLWAGGAFASVRVVVLR